MIKCSVFMDSSLIGNEDVCILNDESSEIKYSATKSADFLPPEIVLILIELFQNMGYNAAYDTVKYVLRKIVTLVGRKKVDKAELQFEISCNGKKFSLSGNTPLTEQQKDRLVNAAVEALLSEWNGKEKSNEEQ